ncbi:hypothetical protein MKEN_00629500 [Mycena kentingensis (nom. inval.)]|nr:hypothetical protein MKEN_00629500 [Mycena kentingensis (nom. inval.)]
MPAPLPISVCIVEDWVHGLYTAIMLITLWVILRGGKHAEVNGSRKWIQIALVVVPYALSTIHVGLNWHWYASAIDDNELPGGPGLLYSLTHIPAWMEAVGDSFFCLNIFFADCVFIWRCWRVWNRRWQVVAVPILATIAGAALAIVIVNDQVISRRTSEPFTAAKKSAEFIKLSSVYFSLSMGTSLLTTLLITLRILMVQRTSYYLRRTFKIPGQDSNTSSARRFNPFVEVLVESAALYSATLLAFVVFSTQKSINVYYAQNIHAQMAGLAPLLIILRIASGKARPSDDWSATLALSTALNFTNPSKDQSESAGSSTLSMSMAVVDSGFGGMTDVVTGGSNAEV